MAGDERTLMERWTGRLKNNPVVVVLILVALVVGGFAQFTTALSRIVEILPWFERARPDLRICDIDLDNKQIDICNDGDAPAPTEGLFLAFSQSWYVKPGWNTAFNVGYGAYIDKREIPPRTKLAVSGVANLSLADKGTEFMIDAENRVIERDETNNCVTTELSPVTCRPPLELPRFERE